MSMIFGKYLNQSGSSYCSAMDYSKDKGHEFLALPKRNMKNRLMRLTDKLLSRKRSIIETVIEQLNNILQRAVTIRRLDHHNWVSPHRSLGKT